MTDHDLEKALKEFLHEAYPDIDVKVKAHGSDPGLRTVCFIEQAFEKLYPAQRFHNIFHLIPMEFLEKNLKNTVWLELAPGENPEDLKYSDEDYIEQITPDVFGFLEEKDFFSQLEDKLSEGNNGSGRTCEGDFSVSKEILMGMGVIDQGELFDIFHVLMNQGAFCDCEILTNLTLSDDEAEYEDEDQSEGPPSD